MTSPLESTGQNGIFLMIRIRKIEVDADKKELCALHSLGALSTSMSRVACRAHCPCVQHISAFFFPKFTFYLE